MFQHFLGRTEQWLFGVFTCMGAMPACRLSRDAGMRIAASAGLEPFDPMTADIRAKRTFTIGIARGVAMD
jgi:hypothetical protein